MANTTNYNWETPDDTDLVKDGAAAIRTLGSSVDTTTKALNPSTTLGDIEYRSATANTNTRLGIGTTGQVLTVAGGVPTWATSDDADAIQNALLTTTGDTIYASGASTPARLGIGSTGQILTVAGGVPTWAAPAAGASFAGVSLYITANQYLTNNTDQVITFTDELYDTNAFHSTSSNTGRITIPSGMGGYYQFNCSVGFNSNTTGNRRLQLFKNGAVIGDYTGYEIQTAVGFQYCRFSIVINTTAADYYEMVAFQDSGTTLQTLFQGVSFQAIKVG